MIAKSGKKLWKLENNQKDVLILGADVFHARGNRSVASITSQFGENFSHSYSTVKIQRKEYEEIVTSMSYMVLEHVENFAKVMGKNPKKVIFYRDGVGESMIEKILEFEVKKTVELLGKTFGEKKPLFTEILVTKRIDDRFFVNQGPEVQNPD